MNTLTAASSLLVGVLAISATPPQADNTKVLDEARREQVIERTLELLRERYVFPEVAQAMTEHVRGKLSKGDYKSTSSPSSLAAALTADLQSISKDLHLRVSYAPGVNLFEESGDPKQDAGARTQAAHVNFGFERVERLACNVGYIDLRNFHSADEGGPTAIAAMNFVANTEALIFDLRQNGGGDPEMVALLSSYLFGEKPVHLNSLYWREGDTTEEFWTNPEVPGIRSEHKPVFVLTSGRTFSAAEEFTYNLQCLGRSTTIGETTGGGAHPGGRVAVDDEFAVWIPKGRAINPITGENWEGSGVVPEVDVPAKVALEMAHMMAIEGMLSMATESWRVEELERELVQVRQRIDKLASSR